MTTPMPVAFQWSGGKDSAHALGRLLQDQRYDVRCLVSTVEHATGDSTVHDVPRMLLHAQADAIGLPLTAVPLSAPGLGDYREAMSRAAASLLESGIRGVAYGDLEHSGALRHREELFGPLGLEIVEPLWGMTSRECIESFLQSRIDAVTVVVNADVLERRHVGVALDRAFLDALPAGCDPCGEFGEYHTFVWNAPWFRAPVRFAATEGPRYVERVIGTTEGDRTFRYWQLRLS